MSGTVDWLTQSPEAVVFLLTWVLGSIVAIAALLRSMFVKHPIIVRLIEHRSLIYVDEALAKKVKVLFKKGNGDEIQIVQFRQVDLEILNSNPRIKVDDCSITIDLPSPDVSILGVTAANSDRRTPRLGGRTIYTTLTTDFADPVDPLLRLDNGKSQPVVIVRVPNLGRANDSDRVFLRIHYDGPEIDLKVRGARLQSMREYRKAQSRTLIGAAFALLGLSLLLPKIGVSDFVSLAPLIGGFLLYTLAGGAPDAIYSRLRPYNQLMLPTPVDPEVLAEIEFFETCEASGS